MLLQFLLIAQDDFNVFADHHEVVDIEGYDRGFAVSEVDEDSMVRFCAGVAHVLEPGLNVFVPDMAALFGAIDCFYES